MVMSSKKVILSTDDLPTYKEIIETVSRLRKDYKLLTKIKGTKDTENPDSLKNVAAFLEMLAKREKKNLPKDESFIKNSHDIIIQMFCDEVSNLDDWELKQTIQETDLGKIFNKELFDE